MTNPTPYASGKRWTLYRGDVLRLLPALREEGLQVDGAITDPPYSSGGQFRGDRAGDPTKKYLQSDSKQAKYLPSFSGDNRDQRSLEKWLAWWLGDALALTRPGGIVAVSMDWRNEICVQDALQEAGWVLRGLLPWIKNGGGAPRWAASPPPPSTCVGDLPVPWKTRSAPSSGASPGT